MEASALRSAPHGGIRLGPLRRLTGDDKLVELVRAGREDAFEVIYDRYGRQILSFCRHMLGSREEAEDAVQQAFLSAYNGLVGSEKAIHLRPWLYTIARNQCLSILRARRETAPLEDVEPAVDGLAAEVQRRDELRHMLRDLAGLPVEQRAALVLTELGALSHDEVAQVIDCPREKVKALVFQARSSLASSRLARETPCEEIREQLSTLTGGALRRSHLRRHLNDCEGCRQFQAEVKRQRRAMAVLLPVVPSVGLKHSILAGVGAAGAGGAVAGGGGVVAGGGGLAAILANAGVAKFVVATALVAGGVGGGVAAVEAIDQDAKTAPRTTPSSGVTSQGKSQLAPGQSTPGFAPTRAGGTQAPGKQSGGVANGKRSPKGSRGHSATAPGRAGTSPGKAGTSPGKAGTSPGQAGTSPGQAGTSPGRSGTSPGQQRTTTRSGGYGTRRYGAGSGAGTTGGTTSSGGSGGVVDDLTGSVG